jgi:protocatechuate 3,4-dioxygenase, alpha subunit
MDTESTRIPSSSQTVGPYFRIGMEYLIGRMAEVDASAKDAIEIRGRVLDGNCAPVADAMLEFWNAGRADNLQDGGVPPGFKRAATDPEGSFVVRIEMPLRRLEDGKVQAPHLMVLIFARGLMRQLLSRVYLEAATGDETDSVLLAVPGERRGTLIAQTIGKDLYRWDVVLQGVSETVFFAW